MTFLWILLAVVYVACWVYFGLATFRKGHYWMFWIGFFLPFLWIIGALIAPTDNAAARAVAGPRVALTVVRPATGLVRSTTRELPTPPAQQQPFPSSAFDVNWLSTSLHSALRAQPGDARGRLPAGVAGGG